MPFHWTEIHTQTRIRWPGDLTTSVHLDPVSTHFNLSPAFETVIRDIENWVFPSMFDVSNLLSPNSPSVDPTESIASQDGA